MGSFNLSELVPVEARSKRGRKVEVTTDVFVKRAVKVHGDKFDYSLSQFDGWKRKVKIKCNACDFINEQLPCNHLKGSGCRKCNYNQLPQNQARNHESYEALALKVHGDKFTILTRYVNKRTKIQIQCNQCNHVFSKRPDGYLAASGCPKCIAKENSKSQVTPVEIFERKCSQLHKNRYEYFQDYRGGRHQIKIKCKVHNFVFSQSGSAHFNKKQGCKICSNSKGEDLVRKALENLGVEFEPEKRFPDCRNRYPLPFDFYLPAFNACIEYDGELHYFIPPGFGGEARLKLRNAVDKKKDEYCKSNNIQLLRIPYWEKKNAMKLIVEFLKLEKESA